MAITWNGSALKSRALTEAQSIGATVPTVTEFTDSQYIQSIKLTVAKSTVENASDIVTFDVLITALDGLLNAEITNDFIATNTVDAYGTISVIESETDPKYTDSVTNYICSCKIYTKVA